MLSGGLGGKGDRTCEESLTVKTCMVVGRKAYGVFEEPRKQHGTRMSSKNKGILFLLTVRS